MEKLRSGDPRRVGPFRVMARLGGGDMGTDCLASRQPAPDGARDFLSALRVAGPGGRRVRVARIGAGRRESARGPAAAATARHRHRRGRLAVVGGAVTALDLTAAGIAVKVIDGTEGGGGEKGGRGTVGASHAPSSGPSPSAPSPGASPTQDDYTTRLIGSLRYDPGQGGCVMDGTTPPRPAADYGTPRGPWNAEATTCPVRRSRFASAAPWTWGANRPSST